MAGGFSKDGSSGWAAVSLSGSRISHRVRVPIPFSRAGVPPCPRSRAHHGAARLSPRAPGPSQARPANPIRPTDPCSPGPARTATTPMFHRCRPDVALTAPMFHRCCPATRPPGPGRPVPLRSPGPTAAELAGRTLVRGRGAQPPQKGPCRPALARSYRSHRDHGRITRRHAEQPGPLGHLPAIALPITVPQPRCPARARQAPPRSAQRTTP